MSEVNQNDSSTQISMTVSAWGTGLSQLIECSDLSESDLTDAAIKGALWCKPVNAHKLKRIRDVAKTFSVGDELHLNFNAAVLSQKPLAPTLVADEVNYSIWNKPTGMLSQGSKWSDHCTITQTVAVIHEKPAFLVHRLDKAASGLIVVAHTKNALKKLTDMFANRLVEKHYQVKVHGEFSLDLPLRLDKDVQGKTAVSHVISASYDSNSNTSALVVNIETGRKHQIRDHLHSIAYPVVGDRLFDPDRVHDQDLCLHASSLAFNCPFTNKPKRFKTS